MVSRISIHWCAILTNIADPLALVLVGPAGPDGLPLALATAGAYIGGLEISLSDYYTAYKNQWAKLMDTSPSPLSYEDKKMFSTWDISYRQLKNQNATAAELLKLWAYFDYGDVRFDLLKAGKDIGPP